MAYDFRANQVRLNKIISSGSIPIYIYPSSSATNLQGGINFSTASIGTDVFLFVSGSSTAKSLFGGDVVSSGSIRSLAGITGSVRYVDNSSNPFIVAGTDIVANYNSLGQWEISGSATNFFTSPSNNVVRTTGSLEATFLSASTGAEITGSLKVNGGITGSLSGTIAGNPFIVNGPNITTKYNSLGQWEITGSGGGGGNDFFFSNTLNIIEASGSLYLSGNLHTSTLSASNGGTVTGSFIQGTGNIASGNNSHAEGSGTTASGQYSHAEGQSTTASGQASHSEGVSTTASGIYSHAEGNSTQAIDDGAHAEGRETLASGQYSHAEGYQATAAGDYSHAGGNNTEAFANYQTVVGTFNVQSNSNSLFVVGDGIDSFNRHDIVRVNTSIVEVTGSLANGNLLSAVGSFSHAEGVLTNASAFYAHAEGWQTVASGLAAHSEGYQTTAEGQYSHATGYLTRASGTGSFAAGLGTRASGSTDGVVPPTTTQAAFGKYNIENNTDSLFVVGDGIDAINRHDVLRANSGSVQVTGSLIAPTITGSIQYVDDANSIAYITASSNITVNYNPLGQWEITGSGGGTNYFTEITLDAIATTGSVAMTFLSASTGAEITGSFILSSSIPAVILTSVRHGAPSVIATGLYAYSQGNSTAAQGDYSHAEGNSCVASGVSSHAEGNSTAASNSYAHSEGYQTAASGPQSHAEGQATTASGDQSHAEGYLTTASGYASHAEGVSTIASGYNCHAEGYSTSAGSISAGNAHSEGAYTIASGDSSHAEGSTTTASGAASHAEGYITKSRGNYSHAQGWGSEAYGAGSLAAGLYTVASGSGPTDNPPTTTQASFGKYNLQGNTDSLFVVGDGLNASNRHDVLRVNSGSVEVTGSFTVLGGITGSISGTVAGNPFIVAGSNITANYNSLGQWEITGSGGGGSNFFTELTLNSIATTGSVAMTYLSSSSGAEITGSFILSSSIPAVILTSVRHGEPSVTATGLYAYSQGNSTAAQGDYSHAEGGATVASNAYAHAEGFSTTAGGYASHAEGYSTIASGQYAHAEGSSTTAGGYASHAEGSGTISNSAYSHAEGTGSITNGEYSHAMGYQTATIGTGSLAAGLGTNAYGSIDGIDPPNIVQAAFGKYNTINNYDSLFVVGDGFTNSSRHDVLRVNSGSVQVTGSFEVTGAIKFDTINVSPLFATMTTGDATGTVLSGSLLTSNLANASVGKLDFNVLAASGISDDYASFTFSATIRKNQAGSTLVIAATELDSIYDGTSAAGWDVNINGNGDIICTGSAGNVYWYAQVTKKMILSGSGTVLY